MTEREGGDIQLVSEEKEPKRINPYIAVFGAIGAGKTTFTEVASSTWGIPHFKEQFELNPFLSGFYERPLDFSFKSEMRFLVQKPSQMKSLSKALESSPVIHDTPIAMDYSFGRVQRKMGWMTPAEYNIYRMGVEAIFSEQSVPEPHVYIGLLASGETIKGRVRKRALLDASRAMELRALDKYPEYFDELSKSVVILAKALRLRWGIERVIEVDTEEYDFANNQEDRDFIIREVANRIGRSLVLINMASKSSKLNIPQFCRPPTQPDITPGLSPEQKMLSGR